MSPAETTNTGGLRLLVTVTFNDNQLRSHLMPLLELTEVQAVTLVADRPVAPLPKLRVVVPPPRLVRVFSRAGAKLLVCLWLAVRDRPDWIVGYHFIPHGFNARVVGGLTRTKSLYHMIGGQTEWLGGGFTSENRILGRLPFSIGLLERFLLRLIGTCTTVGALGEVGRTTLLAKGVAPQRIRILRPSVDTDRFRASPNGATGTYDLLTVGRLARRKRTEDFIRAVTELRSRGKNVSAAIVGDGPLEAELRQLARELGVDDCIEFLGFRSDVEDIYRAARVFVLTSESEGLPISMLEAMAAQVPPVVPDVGEIGGFVTNGESGLVFRPGDLDSLTRSLSSLLEDQQLRESMGAAAARRVDEAASVTAVASEYRDLFSSHP